MARLKKADLLIRFEEAVRQSGWSLLYISKDTHPARYHVHRDGRGAKVKVYIWNITLGGKNRPAWERRIQPTGVGHFIQEVGGKTLVLGWQEDIGVFSGWDVRKHLGSLGSSSSFQTHEDALGKALHFGFSSYLKANDETAIAFRPDFTGTYMEFLEPLHDSGTVPAEATLLAQLSEDPDQVGDSDIEDEVEEPRKYAILSTKRALRAIDFNRRVLGAYGHRCAMCGLQLRLVDGAHILPVAHPRSTDRTANGVALCALHHRAYDRSLVTFDTLFKVHINENTVLKLRADHRIERLKDFRAALRPFIFTPADKRDSPARKIVEQANCLRGWKL